MTKVMTVVGTRPEIIRLSEVIKRLDATVDHILVHTGQNYDYELNQVFFEDLAIRNPDHYLGIDTSSLGKAIGGIISKIEPVLIAERPDAFLVLGDTNSCLSAVIAKRLHVPVYHLEAGNRCFDQNVPEETNRRIIDHLADFNLAYTEHARRNLLSEGIEPRRILLTGSPMREVISRHMTNILGSDILLRLRLSSRRYFLVSAHREETVDNPQRFESLLDCLETVAGTFGDPVVVSTHPRTRKRLQEARRISPTVLFHPPLSFTDYNHLQLHARCVLSDSGTISEESAILGFPAVTLRESIERPEALDAGTILLAGLDPDNLIEAVRFAESTRRAGGDHPIPSEYTVDDFSTRTVSYILSTYRRHSRWAGLMVRP